MYPAVCLRILPLRLALLAGLVLTSRMVLAGLVLTVRMALRDPVLTVRMPRPGPYLLSQTTTDAEHRSLVGTPSFQVPNMRCSVLTSVSKRDARYGRRHRPTRAVSYAQYSNMYLHAMPGTEMDKCLYAMSGTVSGHWRDCHVLVSQPAATRQNTRRFGFLLFLPCLLFLLSRKIHLQKHTVSAALKTLSVLQASFSSSRASLCRTASAGQNSPNLRRNLESNPNANAPKCSSNLRDLDREPEQTCLLLTPAYMTLKTPKPLDRGP